MADDRNDLIKEQAIERRAERRRRLMAQTDSPVLRRVVGGLIIVATIYYGLYGPRSYERGTTDKVTSKTIDQGRTGKPQPPVFTLPGIGLKTPAPAQSGAGEAPDNGRVNQKVSALNAETLATISDCTKGIDSFRLIDLKATTLDQVLAPVLPKKLQMELHNVRMQIATGREWRLHASPEGQAGGLRFKLFQVAAAGLPEPISFPPELSQLQNAPWSADAIEQFKKIGKLIEEETHETYSFRDKTGIQLIRVNGAILDLQAFLGARFLACSRDRARGSTLCQCKKTGQ